MAKSRETFNKKEKEKKRLQLKQEKRQKMEERKANKKNGQSLGEMMAYLDENGNLTNSPPDPRKKRVYSVEDIQISVPKQVNVPNEERTGTVNYFNKAKGFGFINDSTTNERVFFHINELNDQVEESDKVKFYVEQGPRGLNALKVTKMS